MIAERLRISQMCAMDAEKMWLATKNVDTPHLKLVNKHGVCLSWVKYDVQ